MSRVAESSSASSVRVSAKSKESLIEASRRIGEASGKHPHLSDIVDDILAVHLPAYVAGRLAALGQGGQS